jgi:hypothetical protein
MVCEPEWSIGKLEDAPPLGGAAKVVIPLLGRRNDGDIRHF